jgi:gas vesicle protein
MQKLYNVQTGLPEDITTDNIPKALAAGTHAYKKGTKVNVVDEQGESYNLDASELPQALSGGYKLETPDQTEIREYVKENKGIGGAAKVALGQFVDEAALGLPELILNKTSDPLEVAKREALKKEHNLANTAGGLAGFGVGLLNPVTTAGKIVNPASQLMRGATAVGKAAENVAAKAVSSKIAPVAREISEGLTYAAPTAITEAALGDPEAAAETMLAGGALGGIFGAGSAALKPILKLGKEKRELGDTLKNYETDSAFRAIGATPAQRAKLEQRAPDVVEKMPQFLRDISKGDAGVLTDVERLSDAVKAVEITSGKALGGVIKQLDERITNMVPTLDDAAVAELKDGMYDYSQLATKIQDKYINPYKDDIRYNAQLQKVEQELGNIGNFVKINFQGDSKPINLNALREFQKSTKNLINYDKLNNISDLATDARKEIVRDIQDYFKDSLAPNISKVFPDLKDVAQSFKQHNDTYRMATSIEPLISRSAAREVNRPGLGLTDIILGGAGAASGGLLGAATGVAANKAKQYVQGMYNVGGLLFTSDQMKKTAKKLDDIGTKLKDYGQRTKGRAITSLSQLTGDKQDDNYEHFSNKISNAVLHPDQSEITQALTDIGEMGAPQIAQAAQVKTADTIRFIDEIMPKPLTPNNPLLKNRPYKPSDMELLKFKRQMRTIIDPLSAIDDLKDNTLTKDQVEVLSRLYPNLLVEIQQRVYDAVDKNPTSIPYNNRLKLSLILGIDLDPSLRQQTLAILVNQQPVEDPNAQQPAQGNTNAQFTTYPTQGEKLAGMT